MLEIIDIQNEEDFDRRVLRGPTEHTYVVDFWADWCAPCRALGPALESAVADHAERATLVKVNVDAVQGLGARYGVRGIPAVKIFRGGEIVTEFVGAQPEPLVRKILDAAIPSLSDDAVGEAEALLAQGKADEAEAALRRALETDPDHDEATALMASLLMDRGDVEAAEELAERLEADSPAYAKAQAVLARAEFVRVCQEAGGRSAAAMAVNENEKDAVARYRLGCCMAADGDYDMALDQLLESFRLDRAYEGQAARKAMLAIFDVLGADNPVTEEFRTRLTRILFS